MSYFLPRYYSSVYLYHEKSFVLCFSDFVVSITKLSPNFVLIIVKAGEVVHGIYVTSSVLHRFVHDFYLRILINRKFKAIVVCSHRVENLF